MFSNQFAIYTLSTQSNDTDFVGILMLLEIVLIYLVFIIANLIVLRLFWKGEGENEYLQNRFSVPSSWVGCQLCVLDVFFVCFICQLILVQVYYPYFTSEELNFSNWPMFTLLEIEPVSNPGLLNSKAWALAHEGTRGRIMQELEGPQIT